MSGFCTRIYMYRERVLDERMPPGFFLSDFRESKTFVIIQKMCYIVNPLNADNPLTSALSNGEDPNKMTVATAFHRDLHGLLCYFINYYF